MNNTLPSIFHENNLFHNLKCTITTTLKRFENQKSLNEHTSLVKISHLPSLSSVMLYFSAFLVLILHIVRDTCGLIPSCFRVTRQEEK